ncbi:MAG: WecB/TagA/CpsF family glycosyltransferase [Chloroflexota bacterium]
MATETIAVTGPMTRSRGRPALHYIDTYNHTLRRERARIELADVLVDQVDLAGAVEMLQRFLVEPGTHQVVTVNLDFLSIAHRDARFRDIINGADLAVADGMPLVWVSRLKDQALPQRLTGVELVHECCALAARDRRSLFLLGAAPGIAEAAAQKMRAQYPGLRIAGSYSPPYRQLSVAEEEDLVARINGAAPDVLLVALGAPRQDQWISEHRGRLNASIAIGVGCVLDLYAGVVSRAPAWMQHTGLEWTYRLIQEPGRLWRRYILDDLPMLGRLMLTPTSSRTETAATLRQPTEGPAL